MKSIAVTKPDMAVMQRDKTGLSPFGLLSAAFHDLICQRSTWHTGFYREVPLELLEEEQAEQAAAPAAPEIHLDIDLQVILEQLQNKEKNDTPEGRILERVRQLEQSLGAVRAENHMLSVKAKQSATAGKQSFAGTGFAGGETIWHNAARASAAAPMLTSTQMLMQHGQFLQAGNLVQKISGNQRQALEMLLQAKNSVQRISESQRQALEALLQTKNPVRGISESQRQALEALLRAENPVQRISESQRQALEALLRAENPVQGISGSQRQALETLLRAENPAQGISGSQRQALETLLQTKNPVQRISESQRKTLEALLRAENPVQRISESQRKTLEALLQAKNPMQGISGSQRQALETLLQTKNPVQGISGSQRQALEALLRAENPAQGISGSQRQALEALLQTKNLAQGISESQRQALEALLQVKNPAQVRHIMPRKEPVMQAGFDRWQMRQKVNPNQTIFNFPDQLLFYLENEDFAGQQAAGIQQPKTHLSQSGKIVKTKDITDTKINTVTKPYLLYPRQTKPQTQPLKPIAANTGVPAGNGWTPYWQAEHPGFDRRKPVGKIPEGKANYSILLPDILRQRQALLYTSDTAEKTSDRELSYFQQSDAVSLQDTLARQMTENITSAARQAVARQLMPLSAKQSEKLQDNAVSQAELHSNRAEVPEKGEILSEASALLPAQTVLHAMQMKSSVAAQEPMAVQDMREIIGKTAEQSAMQNAAERSRQEELAKTSSVQPQNTILLQEGLTYLAESDMGITPMQTIEKGQQSTLPIKRQGDLSEMHSTMQASAHSSEIETKKDDVFAHSSEARQKIDGASKTHMVQTTDDSSEIWLAQKSADSLVKTMPQDIANPAEMALLQQTEYPSETHTTQIPNHSLERTTPKRGSLPETRIMQASAHSSEIGTKTDSEFVHLPGIRQKVDGAPAYSPETEAKTGSASAHSPKARQKTDDASVYSPETEAKTGSASAHSPGTGRKADSAFVHSLEARQKIDGTSKTHSVQNPDDSSEIRLAQKSADSLTKAIPQNVANPAEMVLLQQTEYPPETHTAQTSDHSLERTTPKQRSLPETRTIQASAHSSEIGTKTDSTSAHSPETEPKADGTSVHSPGTGQKTDDASAYSPETEVKMGGASAHSPEARQKIEGASKTHIMQNPDDSSEIRLAQKSADSLVKTMPQDIANPTEMVLLQQTEYPPETHTAQTSDHSLERTTPKQGSLPETRTIQASVHSSEIGTKTDSTFTHLPEARQKADGASAHSPEARQKIEGASKTHIMQNPDDSSEIRLAQKSADSLVKTMPQDIANPTEMVLLQQTEYSFETHTAQTPDHSLERTMPKPGSLPETRTIQASAHSSEVRQKAEDAFVHLPGIRQKAEDAFVHLPGIRQKADGASAYSPGTEARTGGASAHSPEVRQKIEGASKTHSVQTPGDSSEIRLAQKSADSLTKAMPQDIANPAEMVLLQQTEYPSETHTAQTPDHSLERTTPKRGSLPEMRTIQASAHSSEVRQKAEDAFVHLPGIRQKADSAPAYLPETEAKMGSASAHSPKARQKTNGASKTHSVQTPGDSSEIRLAQKSAHSFTQTMPQDFAHPTEEHLLLHKPAPLMQTMNAPFDMTYLPVQSAVQSPSPQAGNADKMNEAMQNLPDWAKRFLQQPAAKPLHTMSWHAQTDPQSLPPSQRQIQWQAPNAVQQPANIVYREQEQKQQQPVQQSPVFTDYELRRTADKVYRLIEDRLRREFRRSGR